VSHPRRSRALAEWIGLGSVVGVLAGASSALFLWLLEVVTTLRVAHEALVWSLPLAGLAIGLVYERLGGPIKRGHNLIIDTLHDGGTEIPLRMAPMVLVGTLLTHMFGGSAGREGTAVQMGASLSDFVAHRLGVAKDVRRKLLSAGVAGGFGAVFGTPIAGTLFGLELVVLGRMEVDALVPSLVAALVGDVTTRALGIRHQSYPAAPRVDLSPVLAAKWALFAVAIGLATTAFIELTHAIKKHGERLVPRLPLRMLLGGAAVVAMWRLVGTSDYLGLGVPTIVRAFDDPTLPGYAFALKLVFTAVTVGSGFLGGEVTPLFFVGATLGATLSGWLGIPIELGAAVGMAATFGAASNTPIALSVMAVELVGGNVLPHAALVCVLAYLVSGHRSIYPAQRLSAPKGGPRLSSPVPLSQIGESPRSSSSKPSPPPS
jgi:H+/Cl- antiporter ClcA